MSAKGIAWVVLLAGLAAVGCSSSKSEKAAQPLPPNVDPSSLFNTVPDAAQSQRLDARPYYLPEDERPTGTVLTATQSAQAGKGEQVSGEFAARTSRAAQATRKAKLSLEKSRAAKAKKAELEKKRDVALLRSTASTLASTFDKTAGQFLNSITSGQYNKLAEAPKKRPTGESYRVVPDPKEEQDERNQLAEMQIAVERAADEVEKALDELLTELNAPEKPLPTPGAKHDILILAGGGSRSLYLHGVVCGWQDSGTMPQFSVVTGVSGGGMAAAALFGGKEYLDILRQSFLGLSQTSLIWGEAWTVKLVPPLGIRTPSIASTARIRKLVQQITGDPKFFTNLAAEHAKGRRLYLGTANVDTQRFVTWDIGAIASEGTPESRKLIEDIVVATSAIPPLMEPSEITVTIDGTQRKELHVDGGAARNLFFYPPADWPGEEEDAKTGFRLLAGARVHVVLGGKYYETPAFTPRRWGPVALKTVGTFQESLQRAELARIQSYCLDREMTLKVAAIPKDLPLPPQNEFIPEESCRLFREGYTRAQDGTAFGPVEGRAVSEDRARRGTVLTSEGTTEIGTVAPVVPLRRPPGQ